MTTKIRTRTRTAVHAPHWGLEHTILLALLVVGGVLALFV